MIQKEKDPSKAHQIKLEVIVKAFKWLEIDMDIDEVLSIDSVFCCIYSVLVISNDVSYLPLA